MPCPAAPSSAGLELAKSCRDSMQDQKAITIVLGCVLGAALALVVMLVCRLRWWRAPLAADV